MKCKQCGKEFVALKGGKFIEVTDKEELSLRLGFGEAPTICRECVLLITQTPKESPSPEDL